MTKTVLIVDDDPTQRRLMQAVLEREGFAVAQADGGEAALDRIASGLRPDVMILDLVMPHMTGAEVLRSLRATGFTAPVVVLTATGGVDTVVQAMQAGANDFFVKPASPERIIVSIRNALHMGQLTQEVDRLKKRAAGQVTFSDLVGASAPMRLVRALGERAAKSSIPVLILGESGVGKEVISRAIHGESDRAGKPFVPVNCGALPEALVESILFGHEKGSFTGAHDRHAGKFQEANGGVLFLDEVGELPLDMQVKLLRALQEREVDPVGAKRPVKVDVRIIAATNRDLADLVKAGRFREDLYYRLNVFPLEAPALRERREDVPALLDAFIRRFNVEEGKRVVAASPETVTLLKAYDWPGNVRQLENAVYRAIVLADAPYLQPHDFPAISGLTAPLAALGEGSDDGGQGLLGVASQDAPPERPGALQAAADGFAASAAKSQGEGPVRILDHRGHLRTLEEIERDLIQLAIEIYAGHMTEVARRLGIGRSTLYRKVREQGLEELVRDAG